MSDTDFSKPMEPVAKLVWGDPEHAGANK